MKIDNINQRLEAKQLEKVQKLAASGDLLSAFFSVREYCNRMPQCNAQLYDYQIELAEALNNPHITLEVSNAVLEVYSKLPPVPFVRSYPFNCLALLRLRKTAQIKRFLRTYNLETSFENFRQKDKARFRKKDWEYYRENTPYDKINLSTMAHWTKLMHEGRAQEVADSDINIFQKGKYYDDLRFRKAMAMIQVGRCDQAIEYIKSTADKEYCDKDLLALIQAYIKLGNANAIQFFMAKAQRLAKTNKIDFEYILPYLEMFDINCYWQEMYDFVVGCQTHRPTENALLLYKAISAYNLDKKQEISAILEQLAIINPYNCVPARIFENAMSLGKPMIRASDKLAETIVQEIEETYKELLSSCQDKDKMQKFVTNKRKMDNICSFLAFLGDKMSKEEMCAIYCSHVKFDQIFRKIIYLDHVNIGRKLNLMYAIITCSHTRSIYFTNNYFMYTGPLYDLKELNKYGAHLKSIYAKAIIYLASLPSNIEIFLPLFNFCTELFIKQIISKNIDSLENEEQIATILINLYIMLTFSDFPRELLISSQGVSSEDLSSFNYHARNFGMKIVDGVLYINEQPVDIVELFQHHQIAKDARLTKKDK